MKKMKILLTVTGLCIVLSFSLQAQVSYWNVNGNSISTPNFIGTNNVMPLVMKTNGVERMRISESGNIGIGTTTPASRLTVKGAGWANIDFQVNGRILTGDADNWGGVWLNSSLTQLVGQATATKAGIFNIGWHLLVHNDGNVVIGDVSPPPGYKLYVAQGILTEKLKVAVDGSVNWPDYVFDEEYNLRSIEELEQFIKTNKHLPNIPSAREMVKNGLDAATMDAKLLEKIEELTLYMIQLKKESKKIKVDLASLKKKVK